MSHATLVSLTSDPRNGVVARHSSVHIVMKREDFGDLKEALVKKLNLNVNKFYPDAGGILMGYQGIKVKKSTSELAPTSLLHPVYIRAQFFLFQPQVGSDLLCVVHTREEGRVSCLAHGVFMVHVINPPKCWETVFVGQTVMVKVEAVEQLAWQEPKILASLVEATGDDLIPLIDFVEEIDADEFESVTDSGMFEYEQNHTRKSQGQNDSQASSTSMGAARGDGWLQSSSKKRKGLDDSPATVASPAKKKPKKDSKSSPLATVEKSADTAKLNSKSPSAAPESSASPHTPSHTAHTHLVKSSDPVAEASPAKKKPKSSPPVADTKNTKSVRKTRHNSKSSVDSDTSPTSQSSSSEPSTEPGPALPPSHQHPMPPPLATSPTKTKASPKKAPANILSKILPKPTKSKSGDSGHESSDNDEVDNHNGETISKATEPIVEGISKNNPTPVNDTVEVNLMPFEALQGSATLSKEPEVVTPSKKFKSRKTAPPGFVDVDVISNAKKKRVKLVSPHAPGKVFISYKAAWEWVDANPDYMADQVKDEPESGAGASGRSSPDMFDSQPEAVEITPVETENTTDKVPEAPQTKPKQPKLPKKFAPTLVARPSQQKLLVDPPSFSESDAEAAQVQAQSQNLLIPESDTEYQSQSLLAQASKVAKKTEKVTKNSPKANLSKSPQKLSKNSPNVGLANANSPHKLSKNSPKVGLAKSPQKVQASSSIFSSVSKSPGKASTDADSGAESAPESSKQVKIGSKIAPTQPPSSNMSTTTKTSNSSSSDSSSEEDLPTQGKSLSNTTISQPKVSPSDSSSSSYESDSSDDDTTVKAPTKTPTRPSESVAKTAVSSSSDSDSDSSEESELDVKKFDHPVTVIVTDPVAATASPKVPGEPTKKVENASKQVSKSAKLTDKKDSSSSSDSESETEASQKHSKHKKLTKKKNSPKSVVPKSTLNTSEENTKVNSTTTEKSPHLSSTVMSGTERLKEQMMVPDGISPILKSRHTSKTPSKFNGVPYFDQVMATSKLGGSQKSEAKPAGADSGASEKNSKKKKKKKPAGFL